MGDSGRITRVLDGVDLGAYRPSQTGARRRFSEHMEDLRTPGASVAVIDNFDVAWARGVGVRSAATRETVASDTPFQAGSISKPVFAIAVMRLCQDGVLDLDADIRSYLKSWRLPEGDGGWTPRITLRRLLSHTAGTTVHGFPGYRAAGPWPTLPQILDGVPPANTQPVVVDLIPGTQFRYSGGGTTIAQLAVMDVVGRPFPELMNELVLVPVGMQDSSFEQPPSASLAARAATGHPWNGEPVPGAFRVYPEMAAAGLWTTAGDLARLGAAVLRTLRGEQTSLGLKPETAAAMLEPQLPGQAKGTDFVGLGWYCWGGGDEFHFGHRGQDEGFLADLQLYPARGQGAAVMINAIQGWPLLQPLLDSIGKEYGWPATVPTPEMKMPAGLDHRGTYRDRSGTAFRIDQTSECLMLQVGDQAPLPLKPAADGSFVARLPKVRVWITRTPGAPATMIISQGDKTIDATQIPE